MDRDHEAVNEVLGVTETVADDRIAAQISFDADDFDVAIAELDARYLAGEAAKHSETWSAITRGYTALNKQQTPLTTPDWVNLDHRLGPSFAAGDFPQYVHAAFDLTRDVRIYVEAVHRLTDTGAVLSHVVHGHVN